MNYNITQKGFTLVEMIAVVAIFTIMTGIVLFNYTKFRSDTILTNMAYEMALSIREAQIYGIGARAGESGDPSTFSRPYGIHVPRPNTTQYFLFADTDNGENSDLEYSGTDCATQQGGDICVTPYTFQRNVTVESIYLEEDNGSSSPTCVLPNKISILFRRPNPEPIVNIGSGLEDDFSRTQLTIKAPDGAKRYVIISNNGQISVENNPICP